MNTNENSIKQNLQQRESVAFAAISGMEELLCAGPDDRIALTEKYPDAAFALRMANSLFDHDREISQINQRAYFAILAGDDIPSIRHRHSKDMDRYLERHQWDK